ncbi:MAG TPA: molybdenum cofactor guanylyltransferase [Opitutaceae bacterium]
MTGLVLAGGYSRRMGTDKSALLLPDGRTLLARQVALLRQAGVDEVLVARRRDQPAAAPHARTVFDIVHDHGPLAGIAAGLRSVREGVLFALAVDMPYLTTDTLRHMISLASTGRGVVPHRGGTIECLIGIYPCDLATLAASRVAAGQLRVREFAALAEQSGRAMHWEIPDRLTAEFGNWNKPEDVRYVGQVSDLPQV